MEALSASGFRLCTLRMLNTFPARSTASSYCCFNSPVASSGSTTLIQAIGALLPLAYVGLFYPECRGLPKWWSLDCAFTIPSGYVTIRNERNSDSLRRFRPFRGLAQPAKDYSRRMANLETPQRPRILSGMRPTGKLHLGNLVGALQNWVKLQNDYESFHFVADWHMLTTGYENTLDLRQDTWEW